MENVTLGQINTIILFLGGFIGGIIVLVVYFKKGLKSALKEDFDGIRKDINDLKEDINEIGISDCKNFLINCFAKIEAGQELDETEKERYSECYDLYTNKYHKNSFIHTKHEKLVKEGKL